MQIRDGVRLPKGVTGGRRKFTTLVDLCQARAAAEPELGAYSFYADGRTEWDALTLSDLDRRARALAVHLTTLAQPGTRALLSFEPGLDFHVAFLGCLYAGLIAVPVAPLDGTRTSVKVSRVESIVASCQPDLLLSTGLTFAKCLAVIEEAPALAGLVRLAVDETDPAAADRWTPPQIGINTPA
ncbi:MAG TPA: AMP-binding protein, partial [Lentzea sp.]